MTFPCLATIGYERATLDEVIARLLAAKVDVVLDVRAIAASRRAGFSKSVLAASLSEADIEYVHLRGLGTPKPGRDAARAGRTAEMRAIYQAHLSEPQAVLDLARACEIVIGHRAALLCFEADATRCHRAIVADLVRARTGCVVADL